MPPEKQSTSYKAVVSGVTKNCIHIYLFPHNRFTIVLQSYNLFSFIVNA